MSELTEFLLARVAEDEHRAGMNAGLEQVWSAAGDPRADQFHVGFSPARVLRECEAKRRIVGLLTDALAWREEAASDPQKTWTGDQHLNALALAVQALAAVYVDHPDFRDEWRPQPMPFTSR